MNLFEHLLVEDHNLFAKMRHQRQEDQARKSAYEQLDIQPGEGMAEPSPEDMSDERREQFETQLEEARRHVKANARVKEREGVICEMNLIMPPD